MKAILKRVEKKVFNKKAEAGKKGQEFTKVEFTCDVIFGDNKVRTLSGSYSIEFARKYFEYVATITGKKMLDYVGVDVEVITEKKSYDRKDGGKGVYEFIKFINVYDAEGTVIKMPTENTGSTSFDF